MTTKHTPGQWKIAGKYAGNMEISDSDECIIATVNLREARDANARLIAAAPELLLALQAMLEADSMRLETSGDPSIVAARRLEIKKQARAAIARATQD